MKNQEMSEHTDESKIPGRKELRQQQKEKTVKLK